MMVRMFKPLLSDATPLPRRGYPFGWRTVYWTLAVVVGIELLLLLMHTSGSFRGSNSPRDLTQQVSVTIQRVHPTTNTIEVVGDLVGIMGIDVVVTPETWIGVDRQLAAFDELRDGLRANISFVLEGERRVARWISASSSRPGDETPAAAAPAEVTPAPATPGESAAAAAPATAVPASAPPPKR
jgi:hypothetical protein